MQANRWLIRAVFVFVALEAADARAAFIDKFIWSVTIDVSLPGTPGPGGLDFGSSLKINSIDFAPGAVTFEGQPVDFDGKEPNFLAGTYAGTLHVPATQGPAIVDFRFDFDVTGPFIGFWSIELRDVPLGQDFSADHFHVLSTSPVNMNSVAPSWNSPIVPQLNGKDVFFLGPQLLENVQPNVARFSLSSIGESEIHAIPEPASGWLLAAGGMLLAVAARARRRAISRARGAWRWRERSRWS